MRSLAVRDFSFFRSRMLSATHLRGRKSRESTEESLSEPRPSDTKQQQEEQRACGEYEVNDFRVANRELVNNRFDQDYLQSRSSVLAYGKQMTRVEETMGEIPPPNARARKTESRSSKIFRRNTSKKSTRQVSWLSRVRRSPSRDAAGSQSQKHLMSSRG